tara:strand:+ start:1882 stop:2793 length:912 start_codon:yes stop_codon:yes gene_type:complete
MGYQSTKYRSDALVKKAKVDAKGALAKEKEKTARQKARLDDAKTNRERKKEESREREKKSREQFKDQKKVKKAKEKAVKAQSAADDQKKKTGERAVKATTGGQIKTASSTGSGTGLSDTANTMASNLGTVAYRAGNAVATVGSAIRAKQKQDKADKLAKKAKKKEKKFDKKYNEEVFYDWREEFLHEVEKRGDKKEKKVIDVMRGKNQIEFNPVTEANVSEDMSGMSQKSGDKRSTESGAGMTAKGVAKYNRRTGGNLKTAVTTPPSKLDPDSKAAKRRKSFCARSKGWTGERGKAARRRWNC